jgi:hypothetical protein
MPRSFFLFLFFPLTFSKSQKESNPRLVSSSSSCAYYRPDHKTDRAATARLDTAAGRPRSGHARERSEEGEEEKEEEDEDEDDDNKGGAGGKPRNAKSTIIVVVALENTLTVFFFSFSLLFNFMAASRG